MRRVDRLVSLLLGLALAGAGVLGGVEIMLLVLGRAALVVPRHQWDQDLRTTRWDSDAAVVASVALLAFGAVLVLLQVAPRRPVRLPGGDAPGRTTWVSRRGLARRVTADVRRSETVSSAHVRVGRSRISVRARAGAGTDRPAQLEATRVAAASSVDVLGVGARGRRQRPAADRVPLRWKVRVDLESVPADATTARHGRRRRT